MSSGEGGLAGTASCGEGGLGGATGRAIHNKTEAVTCNLVRLKSPTFRTKNLLQTSRAHYTKTIHTETDTQLETVTFVLKSQFKDLSVNHYHEPHQWFICSRDKEGYGGKPQSKFSPNFPR